MKKTIALILTVCMLFGALSVSMTAFAADVNAARKTMVIVDLADDGVLRAVADGADAVSAQSDVVRAQREVVQEIEETANLFDVAYTYTHVLNAVAAEVRTGDIEAIRALDGVADVYETAGVKPVIQRTQAAGEITSGEMIGLDEARAMGYDGTGTAIAVIDGGFDVKHEAMRLSDDSTAKFSRDDIAEVIASNQMNSEAITANDVYLNAKIPFAFDYLDEDTILDDNHNSVPSHGTHVSGIAAGNSDQLRGVAPEAQLLLCKIDIYEADAFLANMLAAVDDMAKFDIAAMNLSVGIEMEIPTDPVHDLLAKAFANARKSGVLVCVAAGNEERLSNEVYMPDNGMNGIPNGFAGATSVASVDNIYLSDRVEKYPKEIIYDGDKTVDVQMWGSILPFPKDDLMMVPMGKLRPTGDLTGKCALVYREQFNYNSAIKSIIKSDAAAAILCYNVYEVTNYDLLDELAGIKPVLIVDDIDAYRLYHASDKPIRLLYSEGYYEEPAEQLQPSYFTSWGIGEDGGMTVDIAAPGGVIYSSVPGGEYAVMNGTSMASPHICGVGALAEQYLAKKAPSATGAAKSDLMESLLMSTAEPIVQEDGAIVPVRSVGAGLVNLSRALKANAVLTDGKDHSALNLGDGLTDSFKMTFTVKNFSDQSVRYDTLNVTVGSDEYTAEREFNAHTGEYDVVYYTTGNGAAMQCTTQSDMPRSITLAPGESREVTLTVQIDKATFDKYAEIFTNGFFVEGYVYLSDSIGDNTALNIPFLGFAGDWDAVPVFNEYEDWWGDVALYVVRSLRELRYELTDAEGKVVAKESDSFVKKGTYIDTESILGRFQDVPDGTYTLTLYGVPVGAESDEGQAFVIDQVTVDTVPPKIVSVKTERYADGSGTITVTMRSDDTSYFEVNGGSLLNASFKDIYPVDGYDHVDANGNYVYVLNEPSLPIGWFVVTAYDAAGLSDSHGIYSPLVGIYHFMASAFEAAKDLPETLFWLFLLWILGL